MEDLFTIYQDGDVSIPNIRKNLRVRFDLADEPTKDRSPDPTEFPQVPDLAQARANPTSQRPQSARRKRDNPVIAQTSKTRRSAAPVTGLSVRDQALL